MPSNYMIYRVNQLVRVVERDKMTTCSAKELARRVCRIKTINYRGEKAWVELDIPYIVGMPQGGYWKLYTEDLVPVNSQMTFVY